ncbi:MULTISPECIES: hypothetical protein [unclassified Legionella]|uniref:hypothetical protein n=1 Tax=unclassified Legionella TaxID=2622702 RepID=UPI003AF539A0
MNSILIQHTSLKTLDESKINARLIEEIFNYPTDLMNLNKELGEKLASLLGANNLPPEVVTLLSRPWQRANMLASWNDKLNLPVRKENTKSFVKRLKKIRKDFTNMYQTIATFMLFEKNVELDIDKIIYNFDETIKYFEDFIKQKFARGQSYSTHYFKRYALNSLFYMGKKMGLSEEGSPTSLNKYVQIVTDKTYDDIDQDHFKFKKIDFIAEYERNKNITPMWFIFNPYCELTNSMLCDITTRFLSL